MSADLKRTLGRIETRVANLNEKTKAIQQDVNGLKKTLGSELVSHRERIAALESYRRWSLGLVTGALLSVFAAWVGHFGLS